MKKLFTFLLLAILAIGTSFAATQTITFVPTSKDAGTLTAPDGVSATFVNTYTNNKEQMTKGKSMTLR